MSQQALLALWSNVTWLDKIDTLCNAYTLIAKDLFLNWENINIIIRSTYTVACNSLSMNNVSHT